MTSRPRTHLFSCILYLLLNVTSAQYYTASDTSTHKNKYLNVYGKELQACSTNGTARTGYTRSGYCIQRSDQTEGSHHICVNLNSTSESGLNFCDVTGQADWCSAQDMPCQENPDNATCAIHNWCVCQWAFASYIQKAGGCDAIQYIQCDAVNIEAARAYQNTYGFETALECLVKRCKLNPRRNFNQEYIVDTWKWFATTGLCLALVATVGTMIQRSEKHSCGGMRSTNSSVDSNPRAALLVDGTPKLTPVVEAVSSSIPVEERIGTMT